MSQNKVNNCITPINEIQTAVIRVLDPNNIKSLNVVKIHSQSGEEECNGRIYVNLGRLSDYEVVHTKDGDVNVAENLRKSILKKNFPKNKVRIEKQTDEDELYVVFYTPPNSTLHIKYGILKNGELYEDVGDSLIKNPLVYTLHSGQKELNRSLYDTYNKFIEFVYDKLKATKLRPFVESEYCTENDSFVSDDICGTAYTYIKNPQNKPVNMENISIISLDPWHRAIGTN